MTPKPTRPNYHHDAATIARAYAYLPRGSTGPYTDTKLRVTIVNWPHQSVTVCARGHLEFKGLVDLVRTMVNEWDIIDTFTCVARCPFLVIQLMP
jgi:hypothetical protein